MCHTLLQHYIPCRHSNVTFYPCTPYLSPQSSHYPLHPNYTAPDPEMLFSHGTLYPNPEPATPRSVDPTYRRKGNPARSPSPILASPTTDADIEEGAEAPDTQAVEVYGRERPAPPTYEIVRREGRDVWVGADEEWEREVRKEVEFVGHAGRDHARARSVAHSYWRLCPGCVEMEMRKREAEKWEVRRVRGTRAWQVAVQSGELAEDGEDAYAPWRREGGGEEVERERGMRGWDVDTRPLREERAVVGRGIRVIGGERAADREMRGAATAVPQVAGVPQDVVDILNQQDINWEAVSPEEAQAALAELNVRLGRRIEVHETAAGEIMFREGDGGGELLSAGQGVPGEATVDQMQADPQRFRTRMQHIRTEEGHIRSGERSGEDYMSDGLRLGDAALGQVTRQSDARTGPTAAPTEIQRLPEYTSQANASFAGTTRFATSRATQPLMRRASTGEINLLPSFRQRGRITMQYRRVRWDMSREQGQLQSVPGTVADGTAASRIGMSGQIINDPDGDRTGRVSIDEGASTTALRYARPVVATAPPGLEMRARVGSSFSSDSGPWATEQLIGRLEAAVDNEQRMRYSTVMWQRLMLGPEPASDPTVHPVTGERYDWSESGTQDTRAPDIYWQLVDHHKQAGWNFAEHVTQAAALLLPWYRRQVLTEAEAANVALQHLGYIDGVIAHYGRGRFMDLLDEIRNAGPDDSANGLVRAIAEGEGVIVRPSWRRDMIDSLMTPAYLNGEEEITLESAIRPRSAELKEHFLSAVNRLRCVYKLMPAGFFQSTTGQEALSEVMQTNDRQGYVAPPQNEHDIGIQLTGEAVDGLPVSEFTSPTGRVLRFAFDQTTIEDPAIRLGIIHRVYEFVQEEMANISEAKNIADLPLSAVDDEGDPTTDELYHFINTITMMSSEFSEIICDDGLEDAGYIDYADSDNSMTNLSPTATAPHLNILQGQRVAPRDTGNQLNDRQRRSQTPSPELHPQRRLGNIPPSTDDTNAEIACQIASCSDHTFTDEVYDEDGDWLMICSDTTHSRSFFKHRCTERLQINSNQHQRRHIAYGDRWYGKQPRPYNDAREHLTTDTQEVLVSFNGCGHSNAVCVEKLYDDEEARLMAQCGCHSFDHCLTRFRRTRSLMPCLDCQFKGLLATELLDTAQTRELTACFGRHARPVTEQRELLSWPLAARSGAVGFR